MKDFLETLEIGEEKIKLSSEDIKNILKKHGEYIKTETEKVEEKYAIDLENKESAIKELKEKIENAPKSDEMESLKEKIADYEQKEANRIAEEQAKEKDNLLNKNISEVISDKQFINDYTRNAIINEVKVALNDESNIGKSTKDIFDEIVKDKEGIFVNPNQPSIPAVSDDVFTQVDKEAFNKMGYQERLTLKEENPELFKQLNES